jgi:hypothetical protein
VQGGRGGSLEYGDRSAPALEGCGGEIERSLMREEGEKGSEGNEDFGAHPALPW